MYVLIESLSGGVVDEVDSAADALAIVRSELRAGGRVSSWRLLWMGPSPDDVVERARGEELEALAWNAVDVLASTLRAAQGDIEIASFSTRTLGVGLRLVGEVATKTSSGEGLLVRQ